MQDSSASESAFVSPRVFLAFALCSAGIFLTILSLAATPLTPATATGQWNIVASPNGPGSQYSYLAGVACASTSNCWAVGWYYDASNSVKTLIQHFDGTSWTLVNAPIPNSPLGPATQDLLAGVTCVNENSCWAVGYFTDGVNVHSFSDHYTGGAWVSVSTSDPTVTRDSEMRAISCVSDNDCWAVGDYQAPGVFSLTPSYQWQTLVNHWDGTSWTLVNSPNETIPVTPPSNLTGQAINHLLGVTCTGPNDCWAAGWFYNAQGESRALVEHYDGVSWSIVPSANHGWSFLTGVTCAAPGNCWAVGVYYDTGPAQTLIEHYDGTAWSIVPSPNNANGQNNKLYAATCASSDDCWAIGVQYSDDSNYRTGEGHPLTLTEHWDGTSWSIVNSSNTGPDDYNAIVAISCADGSDCWAGGVAIDANGIVQTLIEHYTVSVPPLPTSVVSRKTHGPAGDFDVDLPLDGSGIECRSSGANGDYTLVFTFANPLTSVASANVSNGVGSVSNSRIDSTDAHQYIVDLTGVSNAQTIAVSLTNVTDSGGGFSSIVSASMKVLIGDTTADGTVNSGDIAQTKSQSGIAVTGLNFREDVTSDGFLNSADISLVKSKSGTALPPGATTP